MGNDEEEKTKQAEANAKAQIAEAKKAEEERKLYEARIKEIQDIAMRKEAERKEKERRRKEEERRRREEEERQRREEERRRQEEIRRKKENKINDFRKNQNFSQFLDLIYEFSGDIYYLRKTIEVLDEDTLVKKYTDLKENANENMSIIKNTIYTGLKKNEINNNCIRKLILLLLFNEKSNQKGEEVLNKIYEYKIYLDLLFDILLDYDEYFGKDIKFENKAIYKKFVEYALNKGKYLKTLKYLSNNIIQLEYLYEYRDTIFNSKINVKYEKLDSEFYKDVYQIIQDFIKYQKEKGRKFISLQKSFWENYYLYYALNKNENTIQKLDDLYELLKSYSELEPDDSDYKEQLAKNIHNIIEGKIEEENTSVKEQLELLFEKDPYYIYEVYKNKRAPEIFKEIKIYDLNKEEIEYFQQKDLEKIYGNSFSFIEEEEEKKENEKKENEKKENEKKKYFLNIIVERIKTMENFTFIANLIKFSIKKDEKNKNAIAFIELLIKIYLDFEDKDLTEESLLNFLEKVIEYSPNKKVELLKSSLPKFLQNYNIYLKLFDKYKEDNDIQKQLATSSFTNLELNNFIEVVRKLENEEKKNTIV